MAGSPRRARLAWPLSFALGIISMTAPAVVCAEPEVSEQNDGSETGQERAAPERQTAEPGASPAGGPTGAAQPSAPPDLAPSMAPSASAPPSAAPDTPPVGTEAAGRGTLAGPPESTEAIDGAPGATPQKDGEKKKKKKKSKWVLAAEGKFGRIRAKGRVFVRGVFQREERPVVGSDGTPEERAVSSFDFLIRSARLGVKYRAPAKWLRAEVEAEMRKGRAEIRDAYIEARGRDVSAKAGNFKVPVSIIEYDSAWDVPVAERGYIRDILRNWLDIAGRRPGVAASVHPKVKPRPSLTVGLFQGSQAVAIDPGDRDTELLWKAEGFSQNVAARGGLDLGDVEVGLFYEYRVGSPQIFETGHYSNGGADVTLDVDTKHGGFRLWMDGMAGQSWYEATGKPEDGKDATFLLARLIVGYRFGGLEDEQFYVEPYLMAGVFEPDRGVTDDLLTEATLGVNVGMWERARLALEGEWSQVGRNWPEGLSTAVPPKRIAAVLQASVVF